MNWQTLQAAMPGLSASRAQELVGFNNAAMREFAITTLNRAQYWLAHVGHESVSLRHFEEIASGAAYEGRRDLGNVIAGDGRRFKGRGPIQITGRANYRRIGRILGLDLVGQPHLAAQPAHAFRVSAAWWYHAGVNGYADRGDFVGATKRINGGTNGLQDRRNRWQRIQGLGNAVLPGAAAAPPTPKDWFDMATEADLRRVVREESRQPTGIALQGKGEREAWVCSPAGRWWIPTQARLNELVMVRQVAADANNRPFQVDPAMVAQFPKITEPK